MARIRPEHLNDEDLASEYYARTPTHGRTEEQERHARELEREMESRGIAVVD